MYVSPYGKSKGLPDRLNKWADDLGKQKFPWMGTGLIADLQAAAAILDGRLAPTEEETPVVEFDL